MDMPNTGAFILGFSVIAEAEVIKAPQPETKEQE